MQRSEFESRKRELEERLEEDLELVRAGHRARLRALEALFSATQDETSGKEPDQRPSAPARIKVVEPKRDVLWELDDVWDKVPAEFDKRDLYRVLGYQPHRATLARVISRLLEGGEIAIVQYSEGRNLTRYRKVGKGDTNVKRSPG
jgi:hypothetical protein